MWKKFCVSILSICLLGGAALISGSLFAADESTLRFSENTKEHHYVNDEFSYTLTSDRSDETILYVGGGELHGGAFTYQIPFHETNIITISDIRKPGAYQGELNAEVKSQSGSKEISGVLAFTVYGIVYQNDTLTMEPHQQLKPDTYGTLPSDVHPLFTYSSDNEAVAVVDEDGIITAANEGTAHIRMVVFDGTADADRRLYESVLKIEVAAAKTETTKPQIQKGEANDFRFIQTQPVTAEKAEQQKIGYIEHPQSGTYQYELAEKDRKQFEIVDGELYVSGKQKKGKYRVKVTVTSEQDKQYEVTCEYEVIAKADHTKEEFQFRYEGKAVSSIVRPYEAGNNSFQITSNKNLEEVLFQLKNEADAEYLNISQTGNVIIKKISKQPIMVTARWQDQEYECSVMIDKADQQISLPSSEINISPEDGSFDPLIKGRMGNGALVAKLISDEECISLSYSEQGGLVIKPLKVGSAKIDIYNDGDANYKKSNVISLLVHVRKPEVLNKEWLGDAKWLNMQGKLGEEGWYTSAVTLSLQQDAPASAFHYSEESYQKLQWDHNGDVTLPVSFSDEQGVKSTVAKVSFKIDTHAPLITSISERKAADHKWKEWVDELTFQSVFGEGMIIDIHADDTLMDPEINTSGVKEIAYQIYRIENDKKETLLREGAETGDSVSIQIDDTGVHKVCAAASDHAGLKGEKKCQVLNDETMTALSADNSTMLFYSRVFTDSDRIHIQSIDDAKHDEIAKIIPESEEITDVKGFQIEWENHENAIANQPIQVTVPTVDHTKPAGYWVQRKGSGYERIETTVEPTAQILHLSSLEPIYYVETKRSATAGQLGFYLAKPNDILETAPDLRTEVTRISFQPFTFAENDLHLVLYAAGAVLVVCFIILLIRSGREEY